MTSTVDGYLAGKRLGRVSVANLPYGYGEGEEWKVAEDISCFEYS